MKKIILTNDAPQAIGPYSQAVSANGFVFLSGQIPLCAKTGTIEHDIKKATALIFENIKAILKASNLTLGDIVKTTVFLTDINDFAAMNEVYQTYFDKDYPARSTVQVAGLPRGTKVEIECVAQTVD